MQLHVCLTAKLLEESILLATLIMCDEASKVVDKPSKVKIGIRLQFDPCKPT